jgi:hypothetical protein
MTLTNCNYHKAYVRSKRSYNMQIYEKQTWRASIDTYLKMSYNKDVLGKKADNANSPSDISINMTSLNVQFSGSIVRIQFQLANLHIPSSWHLSDATIRFRTVAMFIVVKTQYFLFCGIVKYVCLFSTSAQTLTCFTPTAHWSKQRENFCTARHDEFFILRKTKQKRTQEKLLIFEDVLIH